MLRACLNCNQRADDCGLGWACPHVDSTPCKCADDPITETRDEVRAELDAKYACPTCGTRPVGPGSTSCEVCGSALEQGWIHLAAVVAARLSDEPHLVECPNCHLKLADVGASHCDGCVEGT